jgi:hypothetical protein
MMIIWWSKHVGVILNVLVCDIWINILNTNKCIGWTIIHSNHCCDLEPLPSSLHMEHTTQRFKSKLLWPTGEVTWRPKQFAFEKWRSVFYLQWRCEYFKIISVMFRIFTPLSQNPSGTVKGRNVTPPPPYIYVPDFVFLVATCQPELAVS